MILIKISYIQKKRNGHICLLRPFYPVLRYKQFLFIKNTKKSQFVGYTTRYSFISFNTLHILSVRLRYVSRQKKYAKTPHGILAHASLSLLTLKKYLSYKTKLINYCAVNSTT